MVSMSEGVATWGDTDVVAVLAVHGGFREFLGGLVGEQGSVDVGDLGELFDDCGVDPRMAVTEASDGGTAGAVDDLAAVDCVQIDPFPSRREHGTGEQRAVEDTRLMGGGPGHY